MSQLINPFLLMFYGIPGSGKSFFARQIAERLDIVRLNGDSMRIAMFGSVDNIEKIYTEENRAELNAMVFSALDYAAEQVLRTGQSVVYDAHHNKRSIREKNEAMVRRHGAVSVVVWVRTPFEIALRRGQDRDEQLDQRKKTEEGMRRVIERHQTNMNDPADDEKVITIDGQIPFDEQFKSFQKQMKELYVKSK